MRLTIEIATAALLVICISATSAAFAAGSKAGRSADGLGCSFSVAKTPPRGTLRGDPQAVRRKVLC